MTEGRDYAAHQKANQVEHRIPDPKNVGAAALALPFRLAQTRLRGIVVGVLLGADATLIV
jgi:hypothetical protein